ncbi:MAG TPA: hypothetical protein VFV99_01505 [Kofleriaceae bacterium]|nr:hypothetical protein [Kofleriaceae bacterium]
MRALGARSVTAIVLLAGTVSAAWLLERFRADYWAQLSPWVTFLAGAFAFAAGTLVFVYWSLGERSRSYLRFGEKLPFGEETSLLGVRTRTLLLGHAPYVEVVDVPARAMHALYIAIFFGVALISLDNRAVSLVRDVPNRFDRSSIDYCKPPAPPKQVKKQDQGCKLVERAYKLGYAKSLGSCAPGHDEERQVQRLCTRRQLDEPLLHYAWRRLDNQIDDLRTIDEGPGFWELFTRQLDHLETIVETTANTVAMRPRSSHHVFTNLPDPRPRLRDRVGRMLERGCGARLAHLQHFPPMPAGPQGASLMFEQVLDQLMFNPIYKPIVAQCEEIVVHWSAPANACEQIQANAEKALDNLGALGSVRDVLAWRDGRAELHGFDAKHALDVATPSRIVSFQCLMFDDAAEPAPVAEHSFALDGVTLAVRETRTKPLTADGASQIRLYKQLAALLTPGFGYGRLTSNQAIGAVPEEAAMAESFRQPTFMLTRLDLLRDADLFLGNEWLAKRPDLLAVYPYHLHLKNFIEIFRRQYKEHRGRL